jgi:hypothetical protein
MRWVREHTAEIVVTALALALGIGVFAYAHRDTGTLEESKRRGAAIVEALERHRAAEGTYPGTLEALIPSYVTRIHPPTWGLRRWRYRRYTAAHGTHTAATDTSTVYFQLSVAANDRGYPVLYYDIARRRWVLNN